MSRLPDPQQHDDLLNFQLKNLVAIGGAPAIRLCEGRFGVSRCQWRLVAALTEDGPMSPSQLAARTRWELARISKLLTEILGKGLVERVTEAADQRRATVRVTAAGRKLYAELFPLLAAINRRLMAVLDDDEARVLESCLRKLTERACAIDAEGGGVDVRADRWRGGTRRAGQAGQVGQLTPT